MSRPLHISLDFWGTLAAPNPAFAKARNEYLAKALGKPLPLVREGYTAVKRFLDDAAEKYGIGMPVEAAWRILFGQFGQQPEYIGHLMSDVRSLFLANPPTISPDTITEMYRLTKAGFTFGIASNTNFVPGQVIRDLLDRHRILFLMSGCLFSDELGYAKPSSHLFARIKERAPEGWSICHVGDSLVCDYQPARLAGFDAHQVKNALDLPVYLATLAR